MIVQAQLKAYAKEKHGVRISKEFLEQLDRAVRAAVDSAAVDAAKGRVGTLKARHLNTMVVT